MNFFDESNQKRKQKKETNWQMWVGFLIVGITALVIFSLVYIIPLYSHPIATATPTTMPVVPSVYVYSDVLKTAIPEAFNNLEQCVTEEILADAIKLHDVEPKGAWNEWIQKDVLMQLGVINPVSATEGHIQSFYFRPDSSGCLVEDPTMYSITG